ncbi:hypothetical protein FRC02_009232 [Tulasnella sp. 418]|nr:hypothetical protein FRC02_009232 [Tulasnella sp. 418]
MAEVLLCSTCYPTSTVSYRRFYMFAWVFFLLQRSPASVTVCHGRFFHESGYILEKSAENTTLTSPLLAILPTLETSLQPCFNSSMVGLGRHARQAHVDRCQHPSRPWILSIGMCSRSTPVQTA